MRYQVSFRLVQAGRGQNKQRTVGKSAENDSMQGDGGL
jgi:hypothetical protein